MLMKTTTTLYDVAEHLRTPEDMAAYLEACIEEADGDAAFIAKGLGARYGWQLSTRFAQAAQRPLWLRTRASGS